MIAGAAAPPDDDFAWEDVQVGERTCSGFYQLDEAEVVAFATQYDPLPIHVDRERAAASQFGGLIAAGSHALAIRQRLMHHFGWRSAVIASIGYDEVRFLAPLRAGAQCQVVCVWVGKTPTSKPDRGVATVEQTLMAGDIAVLRLRDLVLLRRRPA